MKPTFCQLISVLTFICYFAFANTFPLSAVAWVDSSPRHSELTKEQNPTTRPITQARIPSGLGKIQEVFTGKGTGTVVLIQDAHGVPEAQRNIQKIIEHFQKEYGVDLIGVEGAASELDVQIFRSFPDPKLLEKVFEEYAQRGEISGGVSAAIFGKEAGIYQGLEDWALYEKGLELYLTAMGQEGKLLRKLREIKNMLQGMKERVYSKRLLEVDRLLEKFQANELEFGKVLKRLAEIHAPQEGTTLRVVLWEMDKMGRESTLEAELEKAASELKMYLESRVSEENPKELKRFHDRHQAYRTSEINAEAFGLYLKETAGAVGFDWAVKFSDRLEKGVENQKRLRDLEGTTLLREFEEYCHELKTGLYQTKKARKLDRRAEGLRLVEKLVKRELSRQEWEKVKVLRSKLSALSEDPEKQNFLTAYSLPLKAHFAFYANAEAREEAMLGNLMKTIDNRQQTTDQNLKARNWTKQQGLWSVVSGLWSNQPATRSAILIAGGFHTEGFTERLKERGISYVLVRPEIGALPENIPYRDQMRGQVSWKEYFRVENGRINLYKAFVRAVRDKLLNVGAAPRGRPVLESGQARLTAGQAQGPAPTLLKSWRDQIIRDLAKQGRIEDSGRYTRFLDEVLPSRAREPQLQDLKERIRSFIQNLRGLERAHQLNEQNIARLLTRASTITAAFTSPGIAAPRAELRAEIFKLTEIDKRSEAREGSINNLVFKGITGRVLDVIEGPIEIWEPEEKKLNISLKNPNDSPEVNETRIHNEIRTVTELWQKLRPEFAAQDEFKADLATADVLIVMAQSYINANGQKAEHVLRESLERYQTPSPNLQFMINRLIELIKDRESLFASELVEDGGEQIKQQIINRHKELLMIRIFDIFLNLPYGFNTTEPSMIHEEKDLAEARRKGFLTKDGSLTIIPDLLRLIESGKTVSRAIKPVVEKLEKVIRTLEPRVEQAKQKVEEDPENVRLQENYMLQQKLMATVQEQANYLNALAGQFDTYDFIYDLDAGEEEREAKKTEETERHQKILSATLKYFPDLSDLLLKVKRQFESFLDAEIQKGRPIEYAAAKFFYKYYEEYSQTHASDAAEPEVIDFLMRYYDIAKHGDQERESDKELIVFAKKIHHEMDYAQLLSSFRGKGKVLAIVSPKEEEEYRIPHWYIFAQKSGIFVISFLDLQEHNVSFPDIHKGDLAMIDGKNGDVVINPSQERRAEWLKNGKIYRHLENYFLSRAKIPVQYEGKDVTYFYDETGIAAFLDRPEGSVVSQRGGKGVKLFRLEEIMVGELDRLGIELDEARLRLAISDILTQSFFADHPIVFRLFDVERDKRAKFLLQGGWDLDHVYNQMSGVRFYLSKNESYRAFREFGKKQLKAIFGARLHKGSKASNVGILFPDVREASEVAEIDELIKEAKNEFIFQMYYDPEFLESLAVDVVEAVQIINEMPVGYMLENTFIVEKERENIMKAIHELHGRRPARRFIGIGTNDLTKSIIEGRMHGEGSPNVLNSHLIRDIWSIGASAKRYGIEVNLEGEWGSSIRMLFILLAMRAQALEELEIMPVAGVNRVPELLEHARNIKRSDLKHFEDLIIRAVLDIDPPTPEELDSVSRGLVIVVYDRIIDSYGFNEFVDAEEEGRPRQRRSELRRVGEEVFKILTGSRVTQRQLQALPSQVAELGATTVTQEVILSWVRARREPSNKLRAYPLVTNETAQVAARQWLVLLTRLENGSQTLGFDVSEENQATVQPLLDALTQPEILGKLRQAVFIDANRNGGLRNIISTGLKGRTPFTFSKSLIPQRVKALLFGEQKVLPVISNQILNLSGNPFALQIKVTDIDGEYDPNLELAEMTLREVIGLLISPKIETAGELKLAARRSEIRGELLKELFQQYPDRGNILHIDHEGSVTVSRSELRRYLTDYLAQERFAAAA